MDFSSFLTSLGTYFIIFLVLMLLFTWLSGKPGNSVIYYPNRILRGLEPWEGKKTRNPFAWIGEALRSSEADVIAAAGVDAAVYFVFMSSVLGILVLSGVVLLPILLPIAATDKGIKNINDSTSNGTFSQLEYLAMGNITQRSDRLWAFLVATYWVTFVTFYILWRSYKHATQIRVGALAAEGPKPEQFTALVRDIPPPAQGQTRKEQVDSYFRTIYPDNYYRSLVITNNKQVDKLYEELKTYKKKLARAEVVFAESKTSSKPEGTRPTNKTGFLGLIGKKVDTIEYCNDKIKELTPKLEAEQKTTMTDRQVGAALIFFNSKPVAIGAGQIIHSRKPDTWSVSEAPESRQLIWKNLPINFYERLGRQYIVYGIVFFTIFFYMIPIGAISAFTTLKNLQKLLPFLKVVINITAIRTILEAFLPQLVLIVFLALLPTLLMFLTKLEGIPSQSHIVRATSGKYFYFIVCNVFIGITIGSALISSIKTVLKNPDSLTDMLGKNLPKSATFFLTFVALKFFVSYGLELSRLVPLIIYHLKRKYLCKTEDEIKEAWAPGDFSYHTKVPNDMLIITITLCYSVIAPLIIPFGVAYFGIGWLILRNQALKVNVPSYESYGRMWPHLHTRIVASLLLYQLVMIGYFGVKEFVYGLILIPLPVLSLIFAYVSNKKFYRAFQFAPLEVVVENKESPNMESVFAAYVPPCLSSDGNEYEDSEVFEDARSKLHSRVGSFA